MRMKKFLQLSAAAAALTLTFAMGATAWAETIGDGTGNSDMNFYYYSSVEEGTRTTLDRKKTVQISQNGNELIYTSDVAEVWNVEEFKVELQDNGGTWNPQSLTISNESEIGVSVTVECTSVDGNIAELQVDGSTTKNVPLQPNSELNVNISAETKDFEKLLAQEERRNIGTVTVTLN